MSNTQKTLFAIILLLALGAGGCNYFGGSFESAASLDDSGKGSQAIQAYQDYLKTHTTGPLAAKACYRVARLFEAQTDYSNAIAWYERVLDQHPGTDEETHALLDLASLYRDQLKNSAKSMEYSQRAFVRYLDNEKVRAAAVELAEAQLKTATTYYSQKDYKRAGDTSGNIFQAYPQVFLPLETRAKVDLLTDRARRADAIAKASVDLILLRKEEPYNKGYDTDFPGTVEAEENMTPSPDGKYFVSRRKAPNGTLYLYLAQVPAKGDQAVFKALKPTFGANPPVWSPDSKELVYVRNVKGRRELVKTDIKTLVTQTLYWTPSQGMLGVKAAVHPAGNMIAYVYAGQIWLTNSSGIIRRWLKNKEKLNYTADLAWSNDGTIIRYGEPGPDKKSKIDNVMILDSAVVSANP